MPTSYAYKVRDREGKMAAGSMGAESEEAVVSRLRQLGYAPISIEPEKGAGLKSEVRIPGTGRVKLKDLAVFSRQFATMINSGLSLLRALTILGEQTSNRRLGEVIIQVRAEVEKGTSLSAAVAGPPPQGLQPPVRVHGPGRRDRRLPRPGAGQGGRDLREGGRAAGQDPLGHDLPDRRLHHGRRDRGRHAHPHRADLREPLRLPRRHPAPADPDADGRLQRPAPAS